jgi:hypothetical protein
MFTLFKNEQDTAFTARMEAQLDRIALGTYSEKSEQITKKYDKYLPAHRLGTNSQKCYVQ